MALIDAFSSGDYTYFHIAHFFDFAFYFLSTLIVFVKSQNIKLKRKNIIVIIVLGIVSGCLSATIKIYDYSIGTLILYILTILMLFFCSSDKSYKTMAIGFISLSFSYALQYISIFIVAVITWAFFQNADVILTELCIAALTLILSWIFMKIKRFRKGIQFFQRTENLGLGITISSIIFILLMIKTPINYITGIVALGVIIFGFGLYLWIRRSITRHYRERMQLKSDEFYKKKLEENESYTQSLLKTNEYMSGVVHRDNHLMSSLSTAIDEYFASSGKTQTDKALRELKALADERRELLNREQQKLRILPSTGNTVIDSALNELFIKAAAHGIDFSLACSEPAAYLINNFLTQTELETLLCDHIKDAIIAVDEKGAKGGRVLVTMAMEGGIYEIKIFDNGVDFIPGVLGRLGIERATSRPDSGGSGIGFMTTFEALKKANACLIIQEFEQKTPFSKAVCFRFDNEHRFIVSTYRADELKAAINRDDVEIISNK